MMILLNLLISKRWNCPLFKVAEEVALIQKCYPLYQFVYLPSNCSTSGVLHVDCGDLSKIKVEEVDSSVSSMDVSWLLWKLRLHGLFLEGVAPCFVFGCCHILDPFQKLLFDRFLTRHRHTTDCVINHIKQSQIQKWSHTSRHTLPWLIWKKHIPPTLIVKCLHFGCNVSSAAFWNMCCIPELWLTHPAPLVTDRSRSIG